jgi:hypothetical protein
MGEELQAVVADLMANIKVEPAKPLQVVTGIVGDYCVRTVTGRCGAGCDGGFTRTERGVYEVVIPCRECGPIMSAARRYNTARFPAEFARLREEWRYHPTLDACEAVAGDVAAGRGRVWYGPTGTGKTWTAAAVGLALVERMPVRWLHWPSFVASLKDECGGGGQLGAVIASRVGSPGVLIVDELCGRSTDFEGEIVERVIGTRAESSPLIVTTNLTQEKARDYVGDRVWSRLGRACRVAEFGGIDRRAAKSG